MIWKLCNNICCHDEIFAALLFLCDVTDCFAYGEYNLTYIPDFSMIKDLIEFCFYHINTEISCVSKVTVDISASGSKDQKQTKLNIAYRC